MLNITSDLKVNIHGAQLRRAVKISLQHASRTLLRSYSLESLDLTTISAKRHHGFAFCKLVELQLLKGKLVFDQKYLENAFACFQCEDTISQEMFFGFFGDPISAEFDYKKVYAARAKRGIGLFLVSLHCEGVITLPATFRWPTSHTSTESGNAGRSICEKSELLSFIRSVETVGGHAQDKRFEVLRTAKRAEWFATYGTKVLLATGWSKPEQANYYDLFEIFKSQDFSRGEISNVSVFKEFAEVLRIQFGERVPEGFGVPGAWDELLTSHRAQQTFERRSSEVMSIHDGEGVAAETAFSILNDYPPSSCQPSKLHEFVKSLPEEDYPVRCLEKWLELETLFLRKTRKENYKASINALGHFNLYLYVYLFAWFREHPDARIAFPKNPDLLVGTFFISRLIESEVALPRTFMEYMDARASDAAWDGNSYYATLKQLELFFSFIMKNAHKILNSTKFVQPLGEIDFPPTTSRSRTSKTPVPRKYLGIFLSYAHAVKSYIDEITENVVSGKVTLERICKFRNDVRGLSVIDCAANLDIALPPLVSINGKTVSLEYFPSIIHFDWKRLVDGRSLLVPHPHSINQIVVSLYTGIRQNHIQWLDAETFDRFVTDEEIFPELLVNTDKKTKTPWRPRVNREVIRVLRDQLAWRKMIAEPNFLTRQFYNNNENTAYPKFLPLFAHTSSGLPHSDTAVQKDWIKLLAGFQGFLPSVLDPCKDKMPVLVKLRPAGVDFFDLDERRKLDKFRELSEGHVPLRLVSAITPHSARVGVVSDLIHYLPAQVIGSRITNQTERVVYYYVYFDSDEVADQAEFQAMDMHRRALEREFDDSLVGKTRASSTSIKADAFNSNLAKSMRLNIKETVARYGCISLVNAEGDTGIDLLESRGIGQAAFNSTEICPYGNNCPPSLIKELKGFRRCSICPFAVRSIDHLPAICAAKKSAIEALVALDRRMDDAIKNDKLSVDELEVLEEERLRLGEEIAGWELCEEVLELARQRLADGQDDRRWVVERPEILLQQFKRVELDGVGAHYLLSRILECSSYPGFQSPLVGHKFDLLRRRILANASGSLEGVLDLDIPSDPAAECMGVMRSLASAHGLSSGDVISILSSDEHLQSLPRRTFMRLVHD